jgi:hypothetical protein
MRFDMYLFFSVVLMVACAVAASTYRFEPRVVLISVDGAIPRDREPGAPVRRPFDGG